MNFKKINICGIEFPILDYETVLKIFEDWIKEKKSNQVCIANVHTIVTCLSDGKYQNIAKQASMITMDGQPLTWYAKLVHNAPIKERVSGPDLMSRCFQHGINKKWKHFLLGGKPEVLAQLKEQLENCYDNAIIAGTYSPPFRALTEIEEEEMIDMINSSNADFLWVGLGAPKQEIWINDRLNKVFVPVQIGVGAAFDFLSGNMGRAPLWMQKYGLEWCYRLIDDPRLWRRYLKTNPVFIYLLVRDIFKKKILRIEF